MQAPAEPGRCAVRVDIVLPVLNEERVLEQSVRALHRHLAGMEHVAARIVVADNGSDDGTHRIARRLAATLPGVGALRLADRGRGRALRRAWTASDAVVVAYMDIDLSTDLAALAPLLDAVISGHAHVAVGSRLSAGSVVTRSLRREVISRVYNRVVRSALHLRVRDAQCGFKAVRADVARALLPLVEDEGWFFDTELLARADRAGCTIAEIPVRWTEDSDTRVKIVRTAIHDLGGIFRLRAERGRHRVGELGMHGRRRRALEIEEQIVDVAVVPPLAGLERPDDGIAHGVVVGGRVLAG